MLTPQACYIVHQSKGYENEADLQTEPIYDTKWKREAIPSDLLESWAVAQAKEGETLAYPPENIYVPKRVP